MRRYCAHSNCRRTLYERLQDLQQQRRQLYRAFARLQGEIGELRWQIRRNCSLVYYNNDRIERARRAYENALELRAPRLGCGCIECGFLEVERAIRVLERQVQVARERRDNLVEYMQWYRIRGRR